MSQQAYQHDMASVAHQQANTQQQSVQQTGTYQQGMLANEKQRLGIEAGTARAQQALLGAQTTDLQTKNNLQRVLATSPPGSPQYTTALAQLRGLTGQGDLPPQYSPMTPPGTVRTNPNNGTADVSVNMGTGKDARQVWVPAPMANNHTELSDPYVVSGQVVPQWAVGQDGKPALSYVPAGAPAGLPTLNAAKAAYDHAHPKQSRRAQSASPNAGSDVAPTSGWGQIPGALGATRDFLTNPDVQSVAAGVDNYSQ
jgi:hypothetical protein